MSSIGVYRSRILEIGCRRHHAPPVFARPTGSVASSVIMGDRYIRNFRYLRMVDDRQTRYYSPPAGGRTMPDEPILRDKAREAIRAGKLPSRRPDRTLTGPGIGEVCTICGEPIKWDQLEVEIVFARKRSSLGPNRYHVHIRCFAAWEFERYL